MTNFPHKGSPHLPVKQNIKYTLYMALTPDWCLLQAERLVPAAEAGGDPGHGPGLRADLHQPGEGQVSRHRGTQPAFYGIYHITAGRPLDQEQLARWWRRGATGAWLLRRLRTPPSPATRGQCPAPPPPLQPPRPRGRAGNKPLAGLVSTDS